MSDWIKVSKDNLPKPNQPFWACHRTKVCCYQVGVVDPEEFFLRHCTTLTHWQPAGIPTLPEPELIAEGQAWIDHVGEDIGRMTYEQFNFGLNAFKAGIEFARKGQEWPKFFKADGGVWVVASESHCGTWYEINGGIVESNVKDACMVWARKMGHKQISRAEAERIIGRKIDA